MNMSAKPIGFSKRLHQGFPTVTPRLVVDDATKAVEFYKKAFGATQENLFPTLKHPDNGKVAHAEIRIGNTPITLTEEFPEFMQKSPKSHGGTPVFLLLYVTDADPVFKQALAAGAKEVIPLADQFYGARGGRLEDPFGHVWVIESLKEDVPQDQKVNRFKDTVQKLKQHKP
jgi:PhnB protein